MSFTTILHQQKAIDSIHGQLRSGRVPHAYLFIGMSGIGRRKTALALAKTLNCLTNDYHIADGCGHCVSCQKIEAGLHPAVQTIDFAWQAALLDADIEKQTTLKIDTIRALQKDVTLTTSEGRWKIYLIEPAEHMTTEAANCLLKILEEPPQQTIFVLLSRHRENLPATIVSRTQIVRFRPLPETAIAQHLSDKCGRSFDEAAQIAAASEGSLERALALIARPVNCATRAWEMLQSGTPPLARLLTESTEHKDEAEDFLTDLLVHAKAAFRQDPATHANALRHICAARGFLRKNCNPQMVLDSLLIELSRT